MGAESDIESAGRRPVSSVVELSSFTGVPGAEATRVERLKVTPEQIEIVRQMAASKLAMARATGL